MHVGARQAPKPGVREREAGMHKFDYKVAQADGDYGASTPHELEKHLQEAGEAGFDLVHTHVLPLSNARIQYTCILKRRREE